MHVFVSRVCGFIWNQGSCSEHCLFQQKLHIPHGMELSREKLLCLKKNSVLACGSPYVTVSLFFKC